MHKYRAMASVGIIIGFFIFITSSNVFAGEKVLAIDVLNEDTTGQVPDVGQQIGGTTGGTGGIGGTGSTGGIGGTGPGTAGCPQGKLCNPIAADTIQELVATILKILVAIGAPIIIFFLIYVGFLFTTARGNTETLSTAKRALIWTLVGGLIVLGAQVIGQVICGTITDISGVGACR